MRAKVFIASLIFLSSLAVFNSSIAAQQPVESSSDLPKPKVFEGKIIFLTIDKSSALTSDDDSVVISDAKIEKIGDRYFVVGSGYGGKRSWYDGMSIGIAWTTVTRFAAMTPEQFEKMSERWGDRSAGGEKQ